MLILVQLIAVGLGQPEYWFYWDEVPGNDNGRLIKFFEQNYGIEWVRTAKIEKIDDSRAINVSTEKNYLSLRLNDEKTGVKLIIDDGRTEEFIARTENGKLVIYSQKLPKAFSNPEDTGNVAIWMALILGFTAFIFLIIKLNKKWIIQAIILISVAWTMYYVFIPFLSFGPYFLQKIILAEGLEIVLGPLYFLILLISIGLTFALYKFPEWYVIDITGIIVGAGAASMFGISLAIIPTLILLVVLAVYDYIAVYRTKHMVALAEGVMDLRLPILLVVPKHWRYSFLAEKFDKEEREAFFMGLGDAVMPTLLVVSANFFVRASSYSLPLLGSVNIPAIGAMLGTLLGFAVLMGFVMKGKPQAGLPFLNGGVILGYVAGSLIAGSQII
ncbi:Signal-peptide peptidase, presenilin aspartyl protease [uncultured archaeon]|nr:Signal-peptide peptidase, presenilin aspartyl protease [uncultured archaeon]